MKKRVLIAGASGLVGRALVPFLQTQGHEVIRLVRREPAGEGELFWNPAKHELDPAHIEGVDAIINLAGENIAGGRWTTARRNRILRSRVDATLTLVTALSKRAPRPTVFVNASAVGFYGDRGAAELTEASEIGHGFLPEVCLAWETAAEGAARFGARVTCLRFGVVFALDDGALSKMLPLFRLGLGGKIAGGHPWMSWVSLADAVGVIGYALADERCCGPLNVVAPNPVTNANFTAILGRVLQRPTVVPVPAWALRLIFGEMAEETLLASTRAEPAKLTELGYTFRAPTLEGALRQALGR